MIKKFGKRVLRKVGKLFGMGAKEAPAQPRFGVRSYAQEGEDMVLSRFFGLKKSGFYIDVGAHHPMRFSNTYKFYKEGWNGINIDAMPGSMTIFNELRPRDINIEVPISDTSEELIFYSFNEPALNTFSSEEAKKKDGLRNYRIVEEIPLVTKPLWEVLDKYLPDNQEIDFLTVDVEGLDLKVLRSNNWEKYRPEFVVVEDLVKQSLEEFMTNSELFDFMKENGYELMGKTFNTLFFKNTAV